MIYNFLIDYNILYPKEYWYGKYDVKNGSCIINGKKYIIVDENGDTSKNAIIEDDKPYDLLDAAYLKAYHLGGRKLFFEVIERVSASPNIIYNIIKDIISKE